MFSFIKSPVVFLGCLFTIVGCSTEVDVYKPVEAPVVTNEIKVEEVWSRSVGSGVGEFYSQLSPAIDDEHIYAASRNGDVYAFIKSDGEKIWHTDLDDEDENDDRRSTRLSGGIALDDNNLYVASENGYLYALSKNDGSLLWKYNVNAEVLAAPASDNTLVFVLTVNGELIAFDVNTGEKKWSNGTDNNILSLRGNCTPVAIGGLVVYGTSDGKINLVKAENGLLLQQLEVGSARGKTRLARLNDVNSSPLILQNELYALAFHGDFQGFILPRANKIWQRKYASYQNMAYDLTDIAITDTSSHVYGIIRVDGSQRWVNTALTYRNVTAPAYYGDYVVVGDYEGYMYWIDGATGEFKLMTKVDSSGLYTAPIVDDEFVYIQSRGGDLYAYKLLNEESEEE